MNPTMDALAKLTARLVYGDESEHERAAALLADCPEDYIASCSCGWRSEWAGDGTPVRYATAAEALAVAQLHAAALPAGGAGEEGQET